MLKYFKKIGYIFLLLFASLPLLTSCSSSNSSNAYTYYYQFNELIQEIKSSGEDEIIRKKWNSTNPSKNDLDFSLLTGENGTLRVATCAVEEPIAYIYEGKYSGLSFDYLFRFGKKYGYKFKISNYNDFGGIINAITTGMADIGCSGISITEERGKNVSFSNPYFDNHLYSLCRTEDVVSGKYKTKEDFSNCNIGVLASSNATQYILKDIPSAKIKNYNYISDMMEALKKKDIEAYYDDSSCADFYLPSHSEITALYVTENNDQYGFVFKKFGYQFASELDNKRIGIYDGSIYESYIDPKVKNPTYSYHPNISTLVAAIKTNKIDAFVTDLYLLKDAQKTDLNIYAGAEIIGKTDVGEIFRKDEKGLNFRNKYNDFLKNLKASTEYNKIYRKWIYYDENKTETNIPYETLPGENGLIKIVSEASFFPFSFIKNDKFTGFEIELMYLFCKEFGYRFEIKNVAFSEIIPSLNSGRADCGIACITITEERAQKVYFSDPICQSEIKIAFYSNGATDKTFFQKIADSFYNTFIKESRWKMFLKGVGVTLLISLCSIIFGLIIGFCLYLLVKDKKKIFNKMMSGITFFMHGIPVVVLLMVFYYLFFGKTNLDGIVVSIICFSLIFSTSVFDMLKNSVNSIDKGQFDASYALGFSKNQTFFKIILPQASRIFFPLFQSGIVNLIKATAIVGYIAVEDLTKISDIVRSRTYESFFPLIVTALIYFLISFIIIKLASILNKKMNTSSRKSKKILKGVDKHDKD